MAAGGDEALVAHRIEDGAEYRSPALDQRQRDRERRKTGGIVAGAVQRVDHPQGAVGVPEHPLLLDGRHLLAEQRDAWEVSGERFGEVALCRQVRFGDEAAVGLVAGGDPLPVGQDGGRGGVAQQTGEVGRFGCHRSRAYWVRCSTHRAPDAL